MEHIKANLSVFATFLLVATSIFITFFLEGDIQIFSYVIIGLIFAFFSITYNPKEEKEND